MADSCDCEIPGNRCSQNKARYTPLLATKKTEKSKRKRAEMTLCKNLSKFVDTTFLLVFHQLFPAIVVFVICQGQHFLPSSDVSYYIL